MTAVTAGSTVPMAKTSKTVVSNTTTIKLIRLLSAVLNKCIWLIRLTINYLRVHINMYRILPLADVQFHCAVDKKCIAKRSGVMVQWTVLLASRMSSTALPGNLAKHCHARRFLSFSVKLEDFNIH
jgi:hypothetical protein